MNIGRHRNKAEIDGIESGPSLTSMLNKKKAALAIPRPQVSLQPCVICSNSQSRFFVCSSKCFFLNTLKIPASVPFQDLSCRAQPFFEFIFIWVKFLCFFCMRTLIKIMQEIDTERSHSAPSLHAGIWGSSHLSTSSQSESYKMFTKLTEVANWVRDGSRTF